MEKFGRRDFLRYAAVIGGITVGGVALKLITDLKMSKLERDTARFFAELTGQESFDGRVVGDLFAYLVSSYEFEQQNFKPKYYLRVMGLVDKMVVKEDDISLLLSPLRNKGDCPVYSKFILDSISTDKLPQLRMAAVIKCEERLAVNPIPLGSLNMLSQTYFLEGSFDAVAKFLKNYPLISEKGSVEKLLPIEHQGHTYYVSGLYEKGKLVKAGHTVPILVDTSNFKPTHVPGKVPELIKT